MTERPILMNGQMVRAVLADAKTQTRRIMKFDQSRWDALPGNGVSPDGYAGLHRYLGHGEHEENLIQCPYGGAGGRLWVRETWTPFDFSLEMKPSEMPRDTHIVYLADQKQKLDGDRYYPSIHMPRWASRITLEVTGVRGTPTGHHGGRRTGGRMPCGRRPVLASELSRPGQRR